MNKPIFLLPLVVLLALGACEFAGNALAPSVTGAGRGAQPAPIVPLDVSQLGQPSNTPAGARTAQFRTNLTQLQQSAVQQVQRGRQLQADMDANVTGYQISAGALTSGQPAAANAGEWQRAQAQLRGVSATLDQMSGLSSEVAKNVAYAAFLLQSIRETAAEGEDQRQLGVLEQSTDQTAASLTQLLDGLRQEVLRQSQFLGVEGAKLAQIAPPSAGLPAAIVAPAPLPSAQPARVAGPAGAGFASGRPFVVIRFDNPGVEYEQQLYEAVSAALARSPEVAFDLVAVAPPGGTSEAGAENAEAARASMEFVRQSLLEMGLPAERVSVSQVTDDEVQGSEVRIYVR
jgi:hypothetical protein